MIDDYPTFVVLEHFICHRLIDKRFRKHPNLHGVVRSGGREPGLLEREGEVGAGIFKVYQ